MSDGDFVHRTGDASVAVESPDPDTNDPDNIKFKFSLKKLWRFAGPGALPPPRQPSSGKLALVTNQEVAGAL